MPPQEEPATPQQTHELAFMPPPLIETDEDSNVYDAQPEPSNYMTQSQLPLQEKPPSVDKQPSTEEKTQILDSEKKTEVFKQAEPAA